MEQEKLPEKRYTVAEYMALEERSDVRHEFFEGEVFAMSGGTLKHNLLVGNCYAALRAGLRERDCRAFFENVQLAVEQGRYYNYPDLMVTCAPSDLLAERTVTSPVLLIEVLSKSTETRDRSWKFNQYKHLPSLQHYLLVSQITCLVEWYRREESGVWSFTPLALFTDELFIPELDLTMRLHDIYEDTGITQMNIWFDSEDPDYEKRKAQ
ncbi:Uma2 family endonuclease [Hymenobacter ruricola]|uniref:Uma2 family endonuclease n=1 Tax=Hymenobacter ruricola TaxID=2791023 RepID=A0ABS0IB35_9BACT|nr:Uma2 family endonuclease [Hymenobacter ruricola]MBF9224165.1 Uma2 family endonuclease [Hymenobacter ruricola]